MSNFLGGEIDLLLAAVVAGQIQLVGGARLQQVAVGGRGLYLGGSWHHLRGSGHHLGGAGLHDVSSWHHHHVACHITLRQTHLRLERIFGVSTYWREYTMF